MSSFKKALVQFVPADRIAINSRLNQWSNTTHIGRVVHTNLDPLERFLHPRRMRQLLEVVLGSQPGKIFELANAYEKECHEHVSKGGPVKDLPPKVLVGRAVEKEDFINQLLSITDFFVSKSHVRDFTDRLLSGDPLTDRELSIPMSKYNSWVTWDMNCSPPNPFHFSNDSAEYIRACLGLKPSAPSSSGLLLLKYWINSTSDLIKPTVADAGLYIFFEPPPSGQNSHGLTKPWLTPVSGPVPSPRPEAVHSKKTFEQLILPIELLP